MLYSLSGKLIIKKPQFVVIETAGISFKIFVSPRTSRNLPKIGSKAKLFCATLLTRENIELYGFLSQQELEIFELLNSISGVGPKAVLKILNEMRPESLLAAISRGRSDLLIKTAGVGQKKANRIILELADKIKKQKSEAEIGQMEFDFDLEEILKSLGYKQNQIREVIRKIPIKAKTIQEKIKFALKTLSRK
ncbi:Holliday junction branch migration protein RuvA [Candidatus Wolfebacteria bacterium CG18_big_fil_WC_8_21_14_2_50_39_7]|uniref:Holliday junction branch migration complex subunit RuvA n=1 Tax=Candidatus Wolfebacteria bacterium CG18_big_fil_WC_8_21_14_2_50_39_7 TaxID=1975071 RepID=A0A2H0EBX9_9BACT|nr:MAG: Holliday junction branch migration protein RuvA [Candidatus Wolfebacteria bacterium CG18_big_fil_WC_8_21_14_2_50_39_7]